MPEGATGTPAVITCPYCWETFETWVDPAAGGQEYYEDCPVCCNPVRLQVRLAADGGPGPVEAARGND